MFTYTSLQKSGFKFSPDDPLMVHDDRMRGIIRWGPYRKVANPAQIGRASCRERV